MNVPTSMIQLTIRHEKSGRSMPTVSSSPPGDHFSHVLEHHLQSTAIESRHAAPGDASTFSEEKTIRQVEPDENHEPSDESSVIDEQTDPKLPDVAIALFLDVFVATTHIDRGDQVKPRVHVSGSDGAAGPGSMGISPSRYVPASDNTTAEVIDPSRLRRASHQLIGVHGVEENDHPLLPRHLTDLRALNEKATYRVAATRILETEGENRGDASHAISASVAQSDRILDPDQRAVLMDLADPDQTLLSEEDPSMAQALHRAGHRLGSGEDPLDAKMDPPTAPNETDAVSPSSIREAVGRISAERLDEARRSHWGRLHAPMGQRGWFHSVRPMFGLGTEAIDKDGVTQRDHGYASTMTSQPTFSSHDVVETHEVEHEDYLIDDQMSPGSISRESVPHQQPRLETASQYISQTQLVEEAEQSGDHSGARAHFSPRHDADEHRIVSRPITVDRTRPSVRDVFQSSEPGAPSGADDHAQPVAVPLNGWRDGDVFEMKIDPQQTQLDEEGIEQIVKWIETHTRDDGGGVSLRLHPRHLGELSIDITLDQGLISARLTAQSAEVKALIEASLPELRSSLLMQGLDVSELTVSVGDGGYFGHQGPHDDVPHQAIVPPGQPAPGPVMRPDLVDAPAAVTDRDATIDVWA